MNTAAPGVLSYALELGLDEKQFANDLHSPAVARRVRDDEVGGAHSSIITSPTFFINGARFHDKPDLETLSAAISAAARMSAGTCMARFVHRISV